MTQELIANMLGVRREGVTAMACDGQVTLGTTVLKHGATKLRRLGGGKVLAGFAGSVADALALFTRFEVKFEEFSGNLERAAVELAQEWRTDRALRHLEAMMIVAERDHLLLLAGSGLRLLSLHPEGRPETPLNAAQWQVGVVAEAV